MGNSFFLNFSPHKRRATTYSAFVQDNITLIDERLMLMLGSKFEHNDYTGFEMQPGARISWTPNEKQTVWGSITRAVRVPDRIEDDAVLTVAVVAGPTPIQWVGDRSTESEELIAYELGYRWIPKPNLSLDFAGFFNDYDNLITYDAASATNGNHAESYGFEAAVDWTIEDNWRVRGSYSWFTEDMHGVMPDTDDIDNPRNQFNVRSFLDITNDLEFNSALYYVDNVPGFEASAYFKLDMGLTWRPSDNVEFAVWGQNLLDDHRTQGFDATGGYDEASYIERGVYAQLTFRF